MFFTYPLNTTICPTSRNIKSYKQNSEEHSSTMFIHVCEKRI